MSKLFFYDLETTGVYYWKNGIHQIGAKILIDGVEKEALDFKVRPHEKAVIEKEALEVGKVTLEQIMEYPTMSEVYNELTSVLKNYVDKFDKTDKFHLVGYNNASFDNQFFRAFFTQNNDKYFGSYFWADSIDVYVLASNLLQEERHKLENFKLATVAKYLGIEVDEMETHNALYDIDLTIKIYNKIQGK